MATEQKAYNDEVDRTKKLNDAMKGLGKKLKDSTLGNMPVLNGAVEGASLGSGVAGAAGIIISVAGAFLSLVTSSETFQTLMDNVNPILQAFSDAIGRLLEPILPLVAIISTVLSPLLDMLGSILASTILPIMPFLFNGLKTLGVWILRAAYIIGEFRNKIIDVITGLMRGLASVNFLGARPFAALADTAAALEKNKINLEELAKSIQEVQNLTWDEAMAKAKLASATNDATEAMKNLPSGIKIAALRYQVALPKYHTGGVPSQDGLAILRKNEAVLTPEQQQSLAGAGGNIIIQGDVYGYDDFRRKVNQAREEGKRSSGLGKRGLAGAMA
jgi:hypothetical protein